jgi:hypothetical protein
MSDARWIFVGFLVLSLIPAVPAQSRPEALTQLEISQLRESAQDPLERLKLYVKFARARLASLEQAHAVPKLADRIHDRLQEFLSVYDELNDNVDTFADRKADMRKPLKHVIEADTEFQAKLRAFKDSGTTKEAEEGQYEFLLTNAIETVDNSAKDHRDLLKEQDEAARHKKK